GSNPRMTTFKRAVGESSEVRSFSRKTAGWRISLLSSNDDASLGSNDTSKYALITDTKAPPTRPPNAMIELHTPRSENGAHLLRMLPLVGYAPACAAPQPRRNSSKAAKITSTPISPVNSDQRKMYSDNIKRAPNRSLNHPEGTCASA